MDIVLEVGVDNSKMTNEELEKYFPDQLNTGKPFVTSIREARVGSDGQEYHYATIVQKRSIGKSSGSSVQKMFLGWDNKRILRVWQNIIPSVLKDSGITVGHVFDDLNIQVEHKLSPQSEGQKPRVYPKSSQYAGQPITHKGNLVYEHVNLVVGEPKDVLLEKDQMQDISMQLDESSDLG